MYHDSAFKYDDCLIDDSNAQYRFRSIVDTSYHGNDYRHNWSNNKNILENNNTFFRKPRICIGKLKPIHKDITITSLSPEEEVFEAVVWCIPILHSKWKAFSTNTSNSYISINIIENNTVKYDHDIPLYWLRGRELPKKCHLGASLVGTETPRKEYADRLPFAYLDALAYTASSTAPISKGGKDESIFLFTHPESQSLYIISPLWEIEKQTEHFVLSYNMKYNVRIKFYSDEYGGLENRFSLFSKSYNDVRFHTHFSDQVHKYWHCKRCPCRVD